MKIKYKKWKKRLYKPLPKGKIISKEKACWICGNDTNLHRHHCIFGSKRKLADDDGLVVYLCANCHRQLHDNPNWVYWKNELKKIAQRHYENNIGTREQFIERYKENYL